MNAWSFAGRSVTYVYEGPLPSVLSKNGRKAHWAVVGRATAQVRDAAGWAALAAMQEAGLERPPVGEAVFSHAHVTVENFWCGPHQLDIDGLAAAAAPLVDAAQDVGLIIDDNPRVTTREYLGGDAQRVKQRSQRRVRVTITEVLS